MGKRISVHDFRDDPMFPRIESVVAGLLATGNVVTPVDVLVCMGLLRPDRLNDWRCGRVPYLERVIDCNLNRLSRLLRILRFHAHDLNLKASATAYVRYGKGPKQRLRFSKTGDAGIEAACSTHFVWPGKRPFDAVRAEPVDAGGGKALAPDADDACHDADLARDRTGGRAAGGQQHDARPPDVALLGARCPHPAFETAAGLRIKL
jgi:hypothetical protein